MEQWISKEFKSLPGSVKASLAACVTEERFDDERYRALCGEHGLGLTEEARKQLLDDVYGAYVEAADSPEPVSWK